MLTYAITKIVVRTKLEMMSCQFRFVRS